MIQIPIFIDLFNTLGANAVPMAFPELYTALETGAVDGQENPLSTIVTAKFYEVQKHVSLTRHVYNSLAVIFSKKTWDKLSRRGAHDPAGGLEGGQAVRARARRERRMLEGARLPQRRGRWRCGIAPAEFERMRPRCRPVTDKYTQEIGPDLSRRCWPRSRRCAAPRK